MAVPILAMVAESTPGVEQRLDKLNNPIREVPIYVGKPDYWRSQAPAIGSGMTGRNFIAMVGAVGFEPTTSTV